MSIFKTIFRSRDGSKNNLFGNSYSFFFGSTTSGKTLWGNAYAQIIRDGRG